DVVGFLHARDALRLMARDQFNKSSLLREVDEIYFIPEGTPLNVQLAKFQRNKERIGLIVDEYGDIQGLITLDDILEEIVGDFTTSMTPAPSDEIHPQPDGSFLVEGSASIRELNKEMSWQLPIDGPRTLNGAILEYLEEIPQPNISLRLAGYPIEILEVENNMVKMARIMPDLYRNESGFED
ncbi:MAG: transporter associated domain-containing protein, partial [Aeromonas hydrophila]|nr:transporter associated domain-containing protein [Aeromonas hydrophila]